MACKSVLVDDMEHCFVCGQYYPQIHHVFFGSKRSISDRFGYVIPLCMMHHTGSKYCPHQDRDIDLAYKRFAQRHFESTIGTRNDFIKLFNKSYIID